MVSGLVTSPCDQLRIFSGDARLMRMASKSAIGFTRSKGLERYKVFLRFLRLSTPPHAAPKTSGQCSVASNSLDPVAQERATGLGPSKVSKWSLRIAVSQLALTTIH